MSSVRFAPEALAELLEAAGWYEARQTGLSDRFLDEVEQLLAFVASRPRSFARLPDVPPDLVVRRALLPRFPYALIFLDSGTRARVLAVAHLRRRPGYWLGRLLE